MFEPNASRVSKGLSTRTLYLTQWREKIRQTQRLCPQPRQSLAIVSAQMAPFPGQGLENHNSNSSLHIVRTEKAMRSCRPKSRLALFRANVFMLAWAFVANSCTTKRKDHRNGMSDEPCEMLFCRLDNHFNVYGQLLECSPSPPFFGRGRRPCPSRPTPAPPRTPTSPAS